MAQSQTYIKSSIRKEVRDGEMVVRGPVARDSALLVKLEAYAHLQAEISFVSVDSAEFIQLLLPDGVLGLAPHVSREAGNFVRDLKEEGLISSAVFSLYLSDFETSNFATFGGYNGEVVAEARRSGMTSSSSDDGVFWMENTSNDYWQVKNFGCDFGGTALALSSENVILDSGSAWCYLPTAEYR